MNVIPIHPPEQQAIPLEAVNALISAHREEMADMEMKLAVARELLMKHGVELEERDIDRHWRECSKVVSAAFAFVMAVDEFREALGTSKELITKFR